MKFFAQERNIHTKHQFTNREILFSSGLAIAGAIAIYLLSQLLAVFLILIYFRLKDDKTGGDLVSQLDGVQAQFVAYSLIAIIGVSLIYLFLRAIKSNWVWLGLNRPKLKHFLYALIGYGWYLPIYFGATILVGLFIPQIDLNQEQQLGFSTAVSGWGLLAVGISLVLVPAIYEELLMRGYLFSQLRKKLNFWSTAIVVSLLFSVAHLQFGSGAALLWAAAIDTFILSIILVYLRERTGSLWPCIGLHATKNFVAFLLLFVFKVA
jgi:membrane protease YdiL (CAAX protease family)